MIKLSRIKVAVLMLILLLSLTGCGKTADGKTHLTFQIWDVYQRPGMQAMCDAYTAQHPDVEIEVQATSWSEYWTKLEASAESNTMPDIFWMHTNQLLYYADFGMLADVTDLYDDVESDYYEKHFSEISRRNASGSDGHLYGVPKDKDNGLLVYNKEMFDAAGISYPTEEWTWEDLAKLPKCADPIEDSESLDQDGRATMSNGLCYSTSARGKNREAALDVIKFFGTEEAQRIQGENGAAIPAYIGCEETWRAAFDSYDEKLDLDVIFDQFDYAVQAVYNYASPKWKSQVIDELTRIYSGNQDLMAGLENMERIVNTETAKKLEK